jgi:hypothetical protein
MKLAHGWVTSQIRPSRIPTLINPGNKLTKYLMMLLSGSS